MKEMQILAWDDLAAARGERVEATGSVLVGYNGTEVMLDVSDATRKDIESYLMPILRAGTKPERTTPKGGSRTGVTKAGQRRPSYRSGGGKRRKQELREWADQQVKLYPGLAERYRYETPAGHYYYPVPLKEDYKEATGIDVDAPTG